MEVHASGAEKGGKKRLSVERIYQRKTQLKHILLRPDTYIGSVEESSENMWVWDEEKEAIVRRQITYVPGLYKIFDEILGWLYGGSALLWTPWGPGEVSCIQWNPSIVGT